MRRNEDPGLTGGLREDVVMARRGGLSLIGWTFAVFGVLASYMACLYGTEINQQSLVAFGAWSIASVLVAFVVDFLYKYLLILAVLFIGALWWTDSPSFKAMAAGAKELRVGLCDRIPANENSSVIRDFVC